MLHELLGLGLNLLLCPQESSQLLLQLRLLREQLVLLLFQILELVFCLDALDAVDLGLSLLVGLHRLHLALLL